MAPSPEQFLQFSLPDLVGIVLAGARLAFGIAIFIRQERFRKVGEDQEKVIVYNSLSVLQSELLDVRSSISFIVEDVKGIEPQLRLATINKAIHMEENIFKLELTHMQKELEFLRPRLPPSSYHPIEFAVQTLESVLNNYPLRPNTKEPFS